MPDHLIYYRGVMSLYLFVLSMSLVSCDDSDTSGHTSGQSQETQGVQVSLPAALNENSPALSLAVSDLKEIFTHLGSRGEDLRPLRIAVRVNEDLSNELGREDYQLNREDSDIEVIASDEIGAAYGLYHIAGDLGIRYIHPEQSIFPDRLSLQALNDSSEIYRPHFGRRGFHEHTQHPIVMSEFLLRPHQEGYRERVSNYLKWLFRNRQNTLSFHLLNTIDLEAWLPYLSDIVEEAESYGIDVGFVTGFVDQQQNAFRLVMPDDPRSPEQQIIEKLDLLTSSGIKLMGLQLGTSEFTKPDENLTLEWLNLATAHLSMNRPELDLYAWIHITCGLEQESGTPFYHLPLDADERLGALVHTTMFYTLDHPAPVYDCDNFRHQRGFLDAANGERSQVFFPETAWWLGFDNNVPLVNPITGLSREYDIIEALPEWSIDGHITFTTGREWTYWQYDHYLTQVTWEGDLSWRDYLSWLGPVYGEYAESATHLIDEWGRQQWMELYEENPEIYFYLAGELPQDELGEQAGVIARRPKLAFREVLEMDEERFSSWHVDDFEMLERMRMSYQGLLDSLPTVTLTAESSVADELFFELYTSYELFVKRIEHSIALYGGVIASREGQRELAEQHLSEARAIGAYAMTRISQAESLYRYPLSLLTAENPESLTAYPFAYLHETSTGYFWTRREEQLSQLITDVFDAPPEQWSDALIDEPWVALGESLTLITPTSSILAGALGGFVPRLLFAESGLSEDEILNSPSGSRVFSLAQDYNENTRPDPQTELRLLMTPFNEERFNEDGERESLTGWRGEASLYPLRVRDASGVEIGQMVVHSFIVSVFTEADTLNTLEIEGEVTPDEVIELVTSVAGIEPAALGQLIKNIWELPATEALPDRLPLKISLSLHQSLK